MKPPPEPSFRRGLPIKHDRGQIASIYKLIMYLRTVCTTGFAEETMSTGWSAVAVKSRYLDHKVSASLVSVPTVTDSSAEQPLVLEWVWAIERGLQWQRRLLPDVIDVIGHLRPCPQNC